MSEAGTKPTVEAAKRAVYAQFLKVIAAGIAGIGDNSPAKQAEAQVLMDEFFSRLNALIAAVREEGQGAQPARRMVVGQKNVHAFNNAIECCGHRGEHEWEGPIFGCDYHGCQPVTDTRETEG